jgi:carbon starvation protein
MPGTVVATGLVVACWSWLIFAALKDPRGMGILWTMLGVANQLLAVIALTIGTTWLVNLGRARYAWVTLLPLVWVATTTLTGGVETLTGPYWRMIQAPGTRTMGLICALGIASVMVSAVLIVAEGLSRWLGIRGGRSQVPA